jgi:hypothetical protein
MFMVKTTVYIPEQVKRRLSKLALQQGRSEAQLIREALERLVDEAPRPRPTLPLFSSGDPTLAARFDELMEGFGEQ